MGNVFLRTGADSRGSAIGGGLYNLIIGLVLCWGFLVNWLMVKYIPAHTLAAVNPIIFLLGYFGLCLAGMYLFTRSDNPRISFVGYNLVVIPFGLVVNLIVHRYDPALVLEAIRITGAVTASMMLLGTAFPAFFERISLALIIALVLTLVWELVEIFVFRVHHGIIDWIVALIFCGYIGLDWGRANRIPRTPDNAVDSAAALYMDIINLFVRILRILGRRR